MSAEISSNAIDSGLAAVEVTCGGTFAPTPGGVGVVEAGMTGALVAAGVAAAPALAAVLVYRFLTYIVPILLGAKKEDRYSLPNTRFLLHQPHGGAGGQATDIRIAAEEILRLRERINALISTETGQRVDKVAADSDRNFWMNAEESLEYGLVSRIIESAADVS